MTKGFVDKSEMHKYRTMVVELHDNLDSIPLNSDRRRVHTYIQLTRTFTIAEADNIASLHYNLLERLAKDNGNEQIQRDDNG